MMGILGEMRSSAAFWLARLCVGAIFLLNLSAAVPFLLQPDRYLAAFELQGAAGGAMVRGLGVLFLMWNATYPPVIAQPKRHRTLFGVILVQQLIGILGEAWIAWGLPAGHAALRTTGVRFLIFDISGLAAMAVAFTLLHRTRRSSPLTGDQTAARATKRTAE